MSAANERANRELADDATREAIIDLIRNGRRLGLDPDNPLSPHPVELPLSDVAIAVKLNGTTTNGPVGFVVLPSMVARIRAELAAEASEVTDAA
jgi:hypothetical protein